MDAQRHAGWAKDYDKMSLNEQIAYEQGRLLVFEAKAEGIPLCAWSGNKSDCGPVAKLATEVRIKIGRRILPEPFE